MSLCCGQEIATAGADTSLWLCAVAVQTARSSEVSVCACYTTSVVSQTQAYESLQISNPLAFVVISFFWIQTSTVSLCTIIINISKHIWVAQTPPTAITDTTHCTNTDSTHCTNTDSTHCTKTLLSPSNILCRNDCNLDYTYKADTVQNMWWCKSIIIFELCYKHTNDVKQVMWYQNTAVCCALVVHIMNCLYSFCILQHLNVPVVYSTHCLHLQGDWMAEVNTEGTWGENICQSYSLVSLNWANQVTNMHQNVISQEVKVYF